jgi:hypothetical protein
MVADGECAAVLLQKLQNDAENEEAEDAEDAAAAQQGTYDYLLSMQLYSLTTEKVAQLQSEAEQMEAEVTRLKTLTGKDMWADDLELFLQVGALGGMPVNHACLHPSMAPLPAPA